MQIAMISKVMVKIHFTILQDNKTIEKVTTCDTNGQKF